METLCLTLKSKTTQSQKHITLGDVQRLAKRDGGYREKRSPVAGMQLHDGCSNVAAAYDQDGEFLFSFAVDDAGKLDICG